MKSEKVRRKLIKILYFNTCFHDFKDKKVL